MTAGKRAASAGLVRSSPPSTIASSAHERLPFTENPGFRAQGHCQARRVFPLPPLKCPLLGPEMNQLACRRQDQRRRRKPR